MLDLSLLYISFLISSFVFLFHYQFQAKEFFDFHYEFIKTKTNKKKITPIKKK